MGFVLFLITVLFIGCTHHVGKTTTFLPIRDDNRYRVYYQVEGKKFYSESQAIKYANELSNETGRKVKMKEMWPFY